MAKITPIEKQFKAMLKDLSPFELCLLEERINSMMKLTVKDINDNPAEWEKSIVHPSMFINLANKLSKHFPDNN